ncbi:MAG: hypothetical protein HXY34_11675 [Candidatus Thorarchaeota archaeon]|nr:hypothetical protein [Candidatus Thorarchaeota archaeon]
MDGLLSKAVRESVLSVVTPLQKEVMLQQSIIRSVSDALRDRAEQIGRSYAFIEPEGSTGKKQTQLRGASDIDLFVGLIPEDYEHTLGLPMREREAALRQTMEDIVNDWFIPAARLVSAENIQKTYSQHPYLSLAHSGLEVDILPCFNLSASDIKERGPITAVDRTVHHTRYVSSRLNPRLREDVRILKSFVRACHAYGDKCAVGRMGFTGYSLELLVLFGGGLEGASQRLLSLRENPQDPDGRTQKELRETKGLQDDYVYIMDPTDTSRNVASSFTPRSCNWVIHQMSQLLHTLRTGNDNQVVEMLLERPIPMDPLPDSIRNHSFALEFRSDGSAHYTVLRDKLWSVMQRLTHEMISESSGERRFGRVLSEMYFEGDRYAVGLLVERPVIESSFVRRGPPVILKEAVEKFRSEHQMTFEKDGYVWTRTDRVWTRAEDMARSFMKHSPVDGLVPVEDRSVVTARVLNTLYRYVMRIERLFDNGESDKSETRAGGA